MIGAKPCDRVYEQKKYQLAGFVTSRSSEIGWSASIWKRGLGGSSRWPSGTFRFRDLHRAALGVRLIAAS
jgi:hypothetical protein